MKYSRFFHKLTFIGIVFTLLQGHAIAAGNSLFVYAGAGLRPAIEKLSLIFEQRQGVKVNVDYGGSGQQLARLNISHRGDLFVPGSKIYLQKLSASGDLLSLQNIAIHTPVLAINKNKSAQIMRFSDLSKAGIRIGLGDPKAMALGRSAETILERSGMKQAILNNTVVRAATVKQLTMYLLRGDVDAAIISRSDIMQNRDKLTTIPLPNDWYQAETIAVGVLSSTTHPKLAKQFADLLASQTGRAIFNTVGFLPYQQTQH